MNLLKNRPAETATGAFAAAILIAYFAGIKDTEVVLALAIVLGSMPAAITFLVETFKGKPKPTPPDITIPPTS